MASRIDNSNNDPAFGATYADLQGGYLQSAEAIDKLVKELKTLKPNDKNIQFNRAIEHLKTLSSYTATQKQIVDATQRLSNSLNLAYKNSSGNLGKGANNTVAIYDKILKEAAKAYVNVIRGKNDLGYTGGRTAVASNAKGKNWAERMGGRDAVASILKSKGASVEQIAQFMELSEESGKNAQRVIEEIFNKGSKFLSDIERTAPSLNPSKSTDGSDTKSYTIPDVKRLLLNPPPDLHPAIRNTNRAVDYPIDYGYYRHAKFNKLGEGAIPLLADPFDKARNITPKDSTSWAYPKIPWDPIKKGIIKFADIIGKYGKAIGSGLEAMGKGVEAAGTGMGEAMSAFAEKDPFSMILKFTDGLSAMATSGIDGINGMIGSIIGAIGGGGTGDKDGKGGKGSGAMAIIGGVGSILTGAVSMVSSGMKSALKVFNGTLSSILSLLTKMMKTSPVMQAIFDLLNLAFVLFFMPFFNKFGEALLPDIESLINFALEQGEIFANVLASSGIIESVVGTISTVIQGIMELLTSSDFLTFFSMMVGTVLPKSMEFFLKMISFFVKNEEMIGKMITKGFDFFEKMLTSGIIDKMFEFSEWMLDWMIQNASLLFDSIKALLSVVQGIASVIGWLGSPGDSNSVSSGILNGLTLGLWGKAQALGMADGGIITGKPGGTLTLLGEGGQSEMVIPLSEYQNMMNGNRGGITIQFTGNVYGMNDFEDRVTQIMSNVSNKSFFR